MTTTINERTTARIRITFLDFDGAAAQPTSATYRVDDVSSGTAVVASTPLSPSSGVATVTLPASANAILSDRNAFERRRMTVVAQYGADDQVTAEYDFRVANLRNVP